MLNSQKPKHPKKNKLHKSAWLILGLIAVNGCGPSRLKIREVCFIGIDGSASFCRCFYPDGRVELFPISHCESYTAFAPDVAERLNNFRIKCEKAGVRP